MLRIGVVGYGTGGRHFHAPFIEAAEGCTLAGIVARAPATIARVRADFPDLPVYSSLAEMAASGKVDAVSITTPPETRRELVLEAVAAGLHVVADKPFAPDAVGAADLGQAAQEAGVTLAAFHNRRFDSDYLTLKAVARSGGVGQLWRFHSRMDFDEPETLEPGPTGGLLRDLGSHLCDQALDLMGPVEAVDCHFDIAALPEGPTDAGFVLQLHHAGGAMTVLEASKLNKLRLKGYRLYGALGSYVAESTDVQAQDIFAGKRPVADPAGWGFEPECHWGTLRNADGERRVPSVQGSYVRYYEAFARAAAAGTPPPVTAAEATAVLAVLDAARISATEGRRVTL
ncbi:Gfo/Idh/MocA family protein [Mangrovicoccus sp. HB161399]|uniref:Gfo/Idh/MocA family protein n=1 Tax=Mangrovicoccus sp. HB161399 TaxID=2720392 RepID=UPI00155729F1|nr:Gfo/Idh/MocA family oxidoreductase [Mangrovicoccus sp. HB161399]